jgi:tetratricopeptide (TPR) repeat protein
VARRKKVAFKPDAFQAMGTHVAGALSGRGMAIIAGVVAGTVLIVVLAFVLRSSAAAEENAWVAYYKAGGDVERLRAAMETYRSGDVRPFMLFSIARAEAEPPRDEKGELKDEKKDEREVRLGRATKTLERLVEEYPRHYLRTYGLMLLGQLREQMKDYAGAGAAFREALGADPGSLEPALQYHVGRALYLAGAPEEARVHLERAVELSSKMLYMPSQWGGPPRPVQPVWRENARYLLARIGREERVLLPEPAAPPGADAADAPEAETREDEGEDAAARDAVEVTIPITPQRKAEPPKGEGSAD